MSDSQYDGDSSFQYDGDSSFVSDSGGVFANVANDTSPPPPAGNMFIAHSPLKAKAINGTTLSPDKDASPDSPGRRNMFLPHSPLKTMGGSRNSPARSKQFVKPPTPESTSSIPGAPRKRPMLTSIQTTPRTSLERGSSPESPGEMGVSPALQLVKSPHRQTNGSPSVSRKRKAPGHESLNSGTEVSTPAVTSGYDTGGLRTDTSTRSNTRLSVEDRQSLYEAAVLRREILEYDEREYTCNCSARNPFKIGDVAYNPAKLRQHFRTKGHREAFVLDGNGVPCQDLEGRMLLAVSSGERAQTS
jgi:hypothetical protein